MFVHLAPENTGLNSSFRKRLLEKFIIIYFQPFQKQIKVSTKFHNFKPQEMKKKNSAAGGRRRPSLTSFWPTRVTPGPSWSDPGSTPKLAWPSVFRPQRHLSFGFPTLEKPCLSIFEGYVDAVSIRYRYCIDTVSTQYRYCIDTVSILYRYSIVPSFWFLRSGSFVSVPAFWFRVLVPAFWFLRSGSFVPVPAFWFLRSCSFVPVLYPAAWIFNFFNY